MPVEFKKFITRADLRANPDKFYVFGDNTLRIGRGGQAAEMRGEPNAIGVATKFSPFRGRSAYFSDRNPKCLAFVLTDLQKVTDALDKGCTVVVPSDGIGTGLAQLPERAPILHSLIERFFDRG